MIITESGAFRKGHHATLLSPFRDSRILAAFRLKLYTQCVENFSQSATLKRAESRRCSRKFCREKAGAMETLGLLMIHQENNMPLAVDAAIPVYGERPEALAATLSACMKQTYPFSRIFVIDDGSPEPVKLPHWAQSLPQFCLIRLPQNLGISAARNAAIARSNAPLLACINTQALPDPDWLVTCKNYLSNHSGVGACYTRLVPHRPNRILTRWRMRFLETKFGEESGTSPFAPGHAVLFRKEALDLACGYDVRYRLHHEDSDICQRMRTSGWETHYVAESCCISMQDDTLKELATKELRESYWYSPTESSLIRLYVHLSKWTLIRAGRNILKGRFYFIPVDVAIWVAALWTATLSTLHFSQTSDVRTSNTSPATASPPAGEHSSSEIPKKP
jgi:GT2 family glycosyltransferase